MPTHRKHTIDQELPTPSTLCQTCPTQQCTRNSMILDLIENELYRPFLKGLRSCFFGSWGSNSFQWSVTEGSSGTCACGCSWRGDTHTHTHCTQWHSQWKTYKYCHVRHMSFRLELNRSIECIYVCTNGCQPIMEYPSLVHKVTLLLCTPCLSTWHDSIATELLHITASGWE